MVWLHKPPFQSYYSALFFHFIEDKTFAYKTSGFSIILLLIAAIYLIFCEITGDAWPSLLMALAFNSSPFLLNLANGAMGMGQNDLLFIALITFACYTAIRYAKTSGKNNLYATIGLSALAVLTKFLVGLLPLLFLAILRYFKRPSFLNQVGNLSLWVVVAILPICLWYAYTATIDWDATLNETLFSFSHFNTVVEGHDKAWWYHLAMLGQNYGPLWLVFGVGAGFYFQVRKTPAKDSRNLVLASILAISFTLLFFSLAESKLPAFTLVIHGMLAVIVAVFFSVGLRSKTFRLYLAMAALMASILNPFDIPIPIQYNPQQLAFKAMFNYLDEALPENAVIFNLPGLSYVDAMFYSERICYEQIPSDYWLGQVHAKGYIPYIVYTDQDSAQIKALAEDYHLLNFNFDNCSLGIDA